MLCDATYMQELVAEKVDVNFADYDGRTALHLAACEDHADIVTWLLDRGSKPVSHFPPA